MGDTQSTAGRWLENGESSERPSRPGSHCPLRTEIQRRPDWHVISASLESGSSLKFVLQPLSAHPIEGRAARADAELYQPAALIDAVRRARTREWNRAKEHLARLLDE
jgi:hypothetical protein